MSVFPGATPPASSANPSDTLANAGHTALHNNDRDEIRALALKMGTGASIPAAGQVLVSTGAGTSSWAQVNLSTTVTGILPVANGGTGNATLAALKTDMAFVKGDVGLGNVDNTSDATKNSASGTLTNKIINANNNTITNIGASEMEPQEAWIAPTFTNSWVNYDVTYNQCGYYKDNFGIVHLRGLVKNGVDGTSIFTLPAGYRPQYRELLVIASVDHYGRLDIPTDGTVIPSAGTTENGWVCLDGVTFRAYQ